MPASVFLNFTPPDREDLTKLHIFESPNATGPWTNIETVTAVGTYPNYISSYTTNLAASALSWFSIQWEDSKGAKTDQSNSIRGGTETLVGEIVDRVLVRDGTLDEQVVLAETEAIIERYFGTDPYTIDPSTVGYATKNSLAKIVQAKSMYSTLITSATTGDSWTAGLVSMKSSSGSSSGTNALAVIDALMKEAARELGLGVSIVAQMANLQIAGGFSQIVSADISRLMIEVE
jgi:hypothetical protein